MEDFFTKDKKEMPKTNAIFWRKFT